MIWLFPYCTNEKKFKPPDDPTPVRRSIRVNFGIPEDAFVFLTVAKFVDRENPRGVIDAFEHIVVSHPNTWLLMVGAGPQFEEIREHGSLVVLRSVAVVALLTLTLLAQ